MTNKVLCLFHANCADGLGAAWAVHHALGPDVGFVAAKYGDLPPYCLSRQPVGSDVWDASLLEGRDILIVDFSYPLPVLRAMAQEARSVLVLDHHKTAREDLQGIRYPNGNYEQFKVACEGVQGTSGNLATILNLERSGAGLTWDYLSGGQLRPRIIDLIEDRDLWKFRFGDETRAFHAVLASYDWTDLPTALERLDDWNEYFGTSGTTPEHGSMQHIVRNNVLAEGFAILRANIQTVASAVAASRHTIKIAGHTVPCANVPNSMASDAGHLLCSEKLYTKPAECHKSCDDPMCPYIHTHEDVYPDFSATYYDGADGRRHFSLRSPSGGADVGQIAKQMAEKFNQYAKDDDWGIFIDTVWTGGGHEHAAGFDAPLGWSGE